MFAFTQYMMKYYVRSYQYVAPLLVFFVTLFITYSGGVSNDPGTYSMGSILAFLISTWLAYGYTRVEHITQQQITVLKLGGTSRYLRAEVGFICLMGVLIACCSVIYPTIVILLTTHITWSYAVVALVEAVSFSLVGVGIGMFFDEKFFPKRSSALLILALISLVSIIGEQIGDKLPRYLHWIVWVVTPVSHTIYSTGNWASLSGISRLFILTWTFVYAFIILWLYVTFSRRRLFL